MTIDAKQAVTLAKEYALSMFDPGSLANLRLEEIEMKDSVWHVTLSWVDPDAQRAGGLAGALNLRLPRVYKVFEIDPSNGQVLAMTMRTLTPE